MCVLLALCITAACGIGSGKDAVVMSELPTESDSSGSSTDSASSAAAQSDTSEAEASSESIALNENYYQSSVIL